MVRCIGRLAVFLLVLRANALNALAASSAAGALKQLDKLLDPSTGATR